MPKRIQSLRGLILGVDTIRASHNKVLLRQIKVVENPTDQILDAMKITAGVIDACIFASMARLDPVPQNLPDTTISSALEKALQEKRILQGQRFKMSIKGFEKKLNFSDAAKSEFNIMSGHRNLGT